MTEYLTGLTGEPIILRLIFPVAWFAQSHQLGSRYRHGQSHVRQSSNTKSIKWETPAQSNRGAHSRSSDSVRRSGFGVSRAPSLTPKQQLGAILSLLL